MYEITSSEIHCSTVKLPALIEIQLRNNQLLGEAIHNYRRYERYSNKTVKRVRTERRDEEDDMLVIDSEPLCALKSDDTLEVTSIVLPNTKVNLSQLMKQIHNECKYPSTQPKNPYTTQIKAMLESIVNDETTVEYLQNQLKQFSRQNRYRTTKKRQKSSMQISPYENTYGQFYYPNQQASIESSMIEKIVHGVQAMSTALTNSKDLEDILNGTITSAGPSFSLLTERFITQKQDSERLHVRTALDLLLADYRLNGKTIVCRSESLLLSCLLRKILICTQARLLCSSADIISVTNESNHSQIHLQTSWRMSLSSDELIEILGEMYQMFYERIETMKFYFEANDVLDLNTNRLQPSKVTAEQLDQTIKYILREDAVRLVLKLILDRKRLTNQQMNQADLSLKLVLPPKLNELYQPIQKLHAFMSDTQVMIEVRRLYLSQLKQRSKAKAITVNDLRGITSQIWFTSEDFDRLIAEQTITSDVLCQFYTEFHEQEDIDDRLERIRRKIHDHANVHGCLTRVMLKILAEQSNGTSLEPFLDEFHRTPRLLSIVDLVDDLIMSGLVSTTELILCSKRDVIIKKSSLFKHFERISFFRQDDVDLLAEMSLVVREDHLIRLVTERTHLMKQAYIDCIFNTDERRDFLQKNLPQSTSRLSSFAILEFLRHFNLHANCSKIFYWMGLTDENIVRTLIETKTFINEYTLDGVYKSFLTRLRDTLKSGIYYISADHVQASNQHPCQLGCFLTYEQASILVDFADPEYEDQLFYLTTIHDVISKNHFLKNNFTEELSTRIVRKQRVIECQALLQSFHQRILSRQERFERVEHLQKLLLSSVLFDRFLGMISEQGVEYFTRRELEHLEEIKLIDIGVLALLLTLPFYDPSVHEHEQNSSNHFHILEPIIEKYSIFLTTLLLRILSTEERFSPVNETLLSNARYYLSTDEVLKVGLNEQILSDNDIQRIDDNVSNALHCHTMSMIEYADDALVRERLVIIGVFDCILHFNHRSRIDSHLRELLGALKPLPIYKSQLIIEKEILVIKLLLDIRKQHAKLTMLDLNRYLQSYPIPCRLDILNELRRLKLISQSLTDQYTMQQCYELKGSSADVQASFLCYMIVKLIRNEGYIDEKNLDDVFRRYEEKTNSEKFNILYRKVLRDGFLTLEQLVQSARDFFLQDYFDEETLKKQVDENRPVIEGQILTRILHDQQLPASQMPIILRQHIRRRQVIQMNLLTNQLHLAKIAKEKVQRKVDHALSQLDEQPHRSSSKTKAIEHVQISSNLRSLRHHYLQAQIPRNQLHLLVEQGGWNEDVYHEFQRELNLIDSENSLHLIKHITQSISILRRENGSIDGQTLMKHFREHRFLFLADFQLLLVRHGMVSLEDLIDLLHVSRLANPQTVQSYAKRIFSLNVNKFIEISKSREDMLVKKNDVQNNLEKRLYITSTDLSLLLNHVLKLDRLKRIRDMMPTIKNYLQTHPINTFNALKALKLEFDFNHYDMRFLRDLKLLSDTWYKQYLLSRTSEAGPMISEALDDDTEQDDRHDFQFRPSVEEDFDLESLNDFLQNNELPTNLSEARKQAYLDQIKKRKDHIDRRRSNVITDDGHLQLSVNLDDYQRQETQPRVVEQFFPEASTVRAQFLIPDISDGRTRSFIELDFAQEQKIDDYHNEQEQRTITKDEQPLVFDAELVDIEKELPSVFQLPSNGKSVVKERENLPGNEIVEDVEKPVSKPSIGKTPIRKPSLESDFTLEKEDEITSELPIIKDNVIDNEYYQALTATILPASKTSHYKSTSITLPKNAEDLRTVLPDLQEQTNELEQISFQRTLKLTRLNLDQWLDRTLQHNNQLSTNIQELNPLTDHHQLVSANEPLTRQFLRYFHPQLDTFTKNFSAPMFSTQLKHPRLAQCFQRRIDDIRKILREKQLHQELFQQVEGQLTEMDQVIPDTNERFQKWKEDFDRMKKQEYFQVQPILGTRLELAIRTVNADLQLIEQIFNGQALPNPTPNVSLISVETSRPSIEAQLLEDITRLRENLSTIVMQADTIRGKEVLHRDLLRTDIADRLQAIKQEYTQQRKHEQSLQSIKIDIDQWTGTEEQHVDFSDKRKEVSDALAMHANETRNRLRDIRSRRSHFDHPHLPLNVKLKFLPVDTVGTVKEAALCLVDEQNVAMSDALHLIRFPLDTDRFEISTDKHELVIIDQVGRPISDPITFKRSEPVEFEYADEDRRSVRIVAAPSCRITLNVKSIPFDASNHALFVVDRNDRPLSKAVQLQDHVDSTLNTTGFRLVTFLYDEQTDEKVQLSPEQYLITEQQAEFTTRKSLTYLVDHEGRILSEPIQISNTGIAMRHLREDVLLRKLELFNKQRGDPSTWKKEYALLNAFVYDRLVKLKTEEKIIEHIIPILEREEEPPSTDQIEYKREQSKMDHLLSSMKSIVQLDDRLTDYQKTTTTKSIEPMEIQRLEQLLIDQLVQTSTQLADPSLLKQVQNLSVRLKDTELLSKLRPMVLSSIRTHAKTIQRKCESLLMNIQQKSNRFQQPEQVRLEYLQYLSKRFHQERDREKTLEHSYEKIERMQYDLHQRIADSLETMELDELDRAIEQRYPADQLLLPEGLKSKSDRLIYKFNLILRLLHDELTLLGEFKNTIFNEMKRFLIEPFDRESPRVQQILFLDNEIQIIKKEKLLKIVEKFKILLNKIETTDEKNNQYDFLFSKFDRLYEILTHNYQFHLPPKTQLASIRTILNQTRKETKKAIQQFEITRNELTRKLDVWKKKEELKQRTKTISITAESRMSLLNAYIQQCQVEPVNIHHEFYIIKIEQITAELFAMFSSQTAEENFSMMNSLSATVDRLETYRQILDRQKTAHEQQIQNIVEEISIAREYSMVDSLVREQVEDLTRERNELISYQELMIKMQMILKNTSHHLHAFLIVEPDHNPDLLKQLTQNASDVIAQSAEFERLSKRVSPHLLLLHNLTSGQELIPSTTPSSGNLFQLEGKPETHEEVPPRIFLLRPPSLTSINDPVLFSNSKNRILQTEIIYLQKQHAEAIALADNSQQLAIEQSIAVRLEMIKDLQDSSSGHGPVDSTESIEHHQRTDSSMSLSVPLVANRVDEQIHELLKSHVRDLRKSIAEPRQTQFLSDDDPREVSAQEVIHTFGNLRQLNHALKKSRRENNRQKQIDIQLQILDQIDQSNKKSIDQELLQNLREHLHTEQASLITPLNDRTSHDTQTHLLPVTSQVFEVPLKTAALEKNTMKPLQGTLIPQTDSLEQMNLSLITTNAEGLYEELQKIGYSIELALENTRIKVDTTDTKVSLETLETVKKSISTESEGYDMGEASSLSLVGNPRKYTIISAKAREQLIAQSTKRFIYQSQREYGEVHVRNRLADATVSRSKFDENRARTNERLREKIQRKRRLVTFEKTRQGNTVLHRQVDLTARTWLLPQHATSEENLEPIPPLVYVENTMDSDFTEIDDLPFSSRRSMENVTSVWEKADVELPYFSSLNLPTIDEEEETEANAGIAFSLTNQNLFVEKRAPSSKETVAVNKTPSDVVSIAPEIPLMPSIVPHSVQSVREIDEKHSSSYQLIPIASSVNSELPLTSHIIERKSNQAKRTSVVLEQEKDLPSVTTVLNDESLSTQGFDITQEIEDSQPVVLEKTVTYHKVGGKGKRKQKKKAVKVKQKDVRSRDRTEPKLPQVQREAPVLGARKAVPFISATKDRQIDVEEDVPIKRKKKKKTQSKARSKSSSKSPSSPRKKRSKRRKKKHDGPYEKTDHLPSTDLKPTKNTEAIAMHLLDTKKFTGPPVSAIPIDRSGEQNEDTVEISPERFARSRLIRLKPMVKNFQSDVTFHQNQSKVQDFDAHDFDKELFDFETDTQQVDQPALFTEYIPEFFQKQAEEKQIRRISLTAVKTNEHLTKHLAPRIPRLHNGWQPSETRSAHTSEFRPLNKSLMMDISYYFDDDFIDSSGLFQKQKHSDKSQPRVNQPTQRFRDDYIVKEFFNCWKNYATEQARLLELRRKRVAIDFREFWFQDALTDPFYSYFEQPTDYQKKQHTHHQLAYRLHKRLVRTGREQPKETMNHTNRSSFLPMLFNLPKGHLERQIILAQRRQTLIDSEDHRIPLANLITSSDDILPLIRERLSLLNRTATHRDESILKEQFSTSSSLLKQGTIGDLDQLIGKYYTSLDERQSTSFPAIKLPTRQRSSVKHPLNVTSSHQTLPMIK